MSRNYFILIELQKGYDTVDRERYAKYFLALARTKRERDSGFTYHQDVPEILGHHREALLLL